MNKDDRQVVMPHWSATMVKAEDLRQGDVIQEGIVETVFVGSEYPRVEVDLSSGSLIAFRRGTKVRVMLNVLDAYY